MQPFHVEIPFEIPLSILQEATYIIRILLLKKCLLDVFATPPSSKGIFTNMQSNGGLQFCFSNQNLIYTELLQFLLLLNNVSRMGNSLRRSGTAMTDWDSHDSLRQSGTAMTVRDSHNSLRRSGTARTVWDSPGQSRTDICIISYFQNITEFVADKNFSG